MSEPPVSGCRSLRVVRRRTSSHPLQTDSTQFRLTGVANRDFFMKTGPFAPNSDAQVSQTVTFGMLFYPCQTFIRSTGVADGIFFLNICHFGLTSDAQVSQTLILHENPLNRRRKR